MSVKTLGYAAGLTPDTERGPSPQLWAWTTGGNAGIVDFQADPRLGMYFFEDFRSVGITPGTGSAANFDGEKAWYAYADTNGAITDSGIVGGGIHMAASTTAHQGVALGSLTNTNQLITSGGAYQGRLVFECRVQVSTASVAASTDDVFLGLIDASGLPASAVPITNTGGSLATAAGFIGFHKRGGATNGTDFNFCYNVAGGTPVYATNLQNIVNTVTGTALAGATFYKLGFIFDPFALPQYIYTASTGQTVGTIARPIIKVFVNGVAAAAFLTSVNVAGAAFPTTIMGPAIAFKQQSTTAAVNCDVDWISVGQNAIT